MQLQAAVVIQRIENNPLNRLTIYLSELPAGFASSLSDDKQKITIKLTGVDVADQARKLQGQGIVQEVYVQKNKEEVEISILLKDKRGYNAVFLPYSRAIMVEVFDWNKLSTAEDNYHSGLLSIEQGVIASSKKLLSLSAKGGFANAGVFLGIQLMMEGNTSTALDKLLQAEKQGANIPDLYAALFQLYNLAGNHETAEYYRKKFYQKSGLNYIAELKLSNTPVSDSNQTEDYSLLQHLNEPLMGDSARKQKEGATANNENDAFNSKFVESDSASSKGILSDLPPWAGDAVKYGGIFLVLIGLLLFSSYLKWRKRQVEFIREQYKQAEKPANKQVFKEKLATAKKSIVPPPSQVTNAYKKAAAAVKPAAAKKETAKKPELPRPNATSEKKIDYPEETIEQSFERIANELMQHKEYSKTENFEDETPQMKLNPKMELALHLQKEQQRLKETKSGKTELPNDSKKLNEVAKKLGIQQDLAQTKMNFSELAKDKNSINKLAEKFKPNSDKLKK